jgi:hypothetical protein
MKQTLDTVLLLALPASGKSEVRRYLAKLDPKLCQSDFHMGPTVQLDDFPYVHMMRRLDDELRANGEQAIFFHAGDRPFQDARDWGTLIELINEDYADLLTKRRAQPKSAAEHLLARIDTARVRMGAAPVLARLSAKTKKSVFARLEKEAQELLDEKHANYPDTLEGKTLVIEFARGGAHGSAMPLAPPFGYGYSVPMLCPALLERATVLYIWVTPEESRRKNQARANPNDPGSILHHGVPIDVMMNDYGCDDMAHLIDSSDQPGTLRVAAHGQSYHLPVARFDNRVDKTSFVREEPKSWKPDDVKALHEGLKNALCELHRQSSKR